MMSKINNDFYDTLGEEWYNNNNFAMSILREQGRNIINPWVQNKIVQFCNDSPQTILDIGCGGGSLSNHLSKLQHKVTGIDINPNNLKTASEHDETKNVEYKLADACNLPFANQAFSVVAAMDVIEHIENQEKLFSEISRVLKKDGVFLFHTFNRTLASKIIAVWGLNLMPGVPWHTHVYELFMSPEELTELCKKNEMLPIEMTGIETRIKLRTVLKALVGFRHPEEARFNLIPSLETSYMGVAKKN